MEGRGELEGGGGGLGERWEVWKGGGVREGVWERGGS